MTSPSRRRIAIILAICLALAAGVVGFRGVGRWLVRQDTLGKADAIVVLSGGMPCRAEEAGKIFRLGWAPAIWLTKPDDVRTDLQAMGIEYVGEEQYEREVLVHEGVPDDAIHLLPAPIIDTRDEIGEIAREMRERKKTTVIIVTSPPHTRRVRVLWKRLAGRNLRAIVRAAPEDTFDADHWWRNTRDIYAVVREILGLLNAWSGLHIAPA